MKAGKKICVIHANCQAGPLLELMGTSPDFGKFWEPRLYTNYLREDIPTQDLDACELFIYQYLDESWGLLSSQSLLQRLSPKAISICLPNVFFKGYWPFYTSKSPMDFGDALLDRLIDAGADKSAIIRIYYHSDISKYADFYQIAAASLEREREKDLRSPIKIAETIQEYWQSEMLFYTCNHPAKHILLRVAEELSRLLNIREPASTAKEAFLPEYADFELPVHPQVARALRLNFIGEDQIFNVFGRKMTFLQYISRYIDCKQQGYASDFLGYLQLV